LIETVNDRSLVWNIPTIGILMNVAALFLK
jgi:hypothetical protein